MFDAIIPANLPAGGDAYLGYVDGRWPDYLEIAREHGNVPCYGLSAFGTIGLGQGVDREPGDATTAQAAAYIAAEVHRVDRPIGYTSRDGAESFVNAVSALGVPRTSWRFLSAHYGAGEHICGPATCGCPVQADGTQWNNAGPYDESLVTDNFLSAAPHPGPVVPPVPVKPVVPPKPLPAPVQTSHAGDNLVPRIITVQNVPTDASGNGWIDFDLGGSSVVGGPWALTAQPGVAVADAEGEHYDHAQTAYAIGAAAGHIRVTVTDGEPSVLYGISIPVTP